MTSDTSVDTTEYVSAEERLRIYRLYRNEVTPLPAPGFGIHSEAQRRALRPPDADEIWKRTDAECERLAAQRRAEAVRADERRAAYRKLHTCPGCGGCGLDTNDSLMERQLPGKTLRLCTSCHALALLVLAERSADRRAAVVALLDGTEAQR